MPTLRGSVVGPIRRPCRPRPGSTSPRINPNKLNTRVPLDLTDIPCRTVSSGGHDLVLPGCRFVVLRAGFEAAVQDSDEPICELPQRGVVTDFPGTERVVVDPRAG